MVQGQGHSRHQCATQRQHKVALLPCHTRATAGGGPPPPPPQPRNRRQVLLGRGRNPQQPAPADTTHEARVGIWARDTHGERSRRSPRRPDCCWMGRGCCCCSLPGKLGARGPARHPNAGSDMLLRLLLYTSGELARGASCCCPTAAGEGCASLLVCLCTTERRREGGGVPWVSPATAAQSTGPTHPGLRATLLARRPSRAWSNVGATRQTGRTCGA
jgi:hypothetical protein